jgi:peptidoglycan/xylan/chitin deacetylase (PgdA/CDA1 family)
MLNLMLFLIFLYFSPYLSRFYSQGLMRYRCKKNGCIVLSYDDGPGSIMTPVLLDLLQTKNIKATFFVLGVKVDGNESVIERMQSLGHEIGSHGHSHVNSWKTSPWKAIQDIKICLEALEKINILCNLFRPPYGKSNIFTWAYISCKKMTNCWWTDVSGDTFERLPCPKLFAEKVISKGGGVILMHDFDRDASRNEFVLQTTTYLIEGATKHGLKFLTLGQLLRNDGLNVRIQS